ncbi:unnamed protein product, partial [Rotaria sordida]
YSPSPFLSVLTVVILNGQPESIKQNGALPCQIQSTPEDS